MTRIIPLWDYFIFAGKSSLDFRVRVSGNGTHNIAERIIESVTVPGRNGDLTIRDEGFKTVNQTYDAYIVDDFMMNFSAMANYLQSMRGNQRLEDSYHPDEFRMATFAGPIDPETIMDEAGKFTLSFKCQPQRYLKIGEQATVIGAGVTKTMRNPSLMEALPLIRVTGNGTFTINGDSVTVANSTGTITIDSDLQDCYEGTANRNQNVTFSAGVYPSLHAGNNIIVVPAGMTVSIVPRWWKL